MLILTRLLLLLILILRKALQLYIMGHRHSAPSFWVQYGSIWALFGPSGASLCLTFAHASLKEGLNYESSYDVSILAHVWILFDPGPRRRMRRMLGIMAGGRTACHAASKQQSSSGSLIWPCWQAHSDTMIRFVVYLKTACGVRGGKAQIRLLFQNYDIRTSLRSVS